MRHGNSLLVSRFLLITSSVIFFLSLEMALRLSPWNNRLGPHRFDGGLEDHSLFWMPDNIINIAADRERIDNEFRGKKVQIEKPADLYRIICLGGSFTYGWPYNDSPSIAYPAVLERLLIYSRPLSNRRYEVINAGVGGYTSYQALFYFQNRSCRLKPDLVTICFGANDSNINYEISVLGTDKEYYEKLIAISRNKLLYKIKSEMNNFRAYALLERIIFNIKKPFFKPKQRVPPQDFKHNLEEFIRLAEVHNFKLLFIAEPHRALNEFAIELKDNPYYSIMYALAEEHPEQVRFVDTISLVKNYHDEDIFYDIMHLTPFGHKVLGDAIYRIIKEWLILKGSMR